ncbi:MAG: hypothetical protein NZ901_00520 [Geminocystis sp.]|nr:hypothetical protein [Geminocystis sp.]HIK38259.1 hypothetical protein [Geminocystis sp. M7585_C2015_104]MCS7146652.1 hypothetical protein [Geminocystis sp.]MCX8077199.1 hypothetical protein [Geminocystis sp.]MDW8115478.1 hypothetical protein [Geminocystis sp.]
MDEIYEDLVNMYILPAAVKQTTLQYHFPYHSSSLEKYYLSAKITERKQRLLKNLISNTIQYNHFGSKVKLTLKQKYPRVIMGV